MKFTPALLAAALPFTLLAACSRPAETTATPPAAENASAAPADGGQGGAVSAPQPNGAINAGANTTNGAVAPASNSFTEGEAKGHIENAGYTDVTGLAKGTDGLWSAKAKKDGKAVEVALDFKGAVSAR